MHRLFGLSPFSAILALATSASGPASAAPVSGQGTWETTLQGRDLDGNSSNGFEAYYDTDLDITWLANASLGNMSWDAARTFVQSLDVYGVSGWRLPDVKPVSGSGFTCGEISYEGSMDCGYNITSSELGHLYYVTLNNKGYYDISGNWQSGYGMVNTGPFSNVVQSSYWSETASTPDANLGWGLGWGFDPSDGGQYYGLYDQGDGFAVWAVHPGDVAAVPEPQAYAILLAGLGALAVAVQRRRRSDRQA